MRGWHVTNGMPESCASSYCFRVHYDSEAGAWGGIRRDIEAGLKLAARRAERARLELVAADRASSEVATEFATFQRRFEAWQRGIGARGKDDHGV
jgi:hypothetical protein